MMEQDINPYRELSADISPEDFELYCMETLKAYAQKEGLQQFQIEHNQKIKAHDGTYQIDVLADYIALGCKHTVIVECKKHYRNIERSVVMELHEKLKSIGAQKAILISTSGFQIGAVKFAEEHGIALWQICNRTIKRMTNAVSSNSVGQEIQLEAEKYMPRFFVMEWDCRVDYPYVELYPTNEMYVEAIQK